MEAGSRILIVSYHAYPSSEIGARRVSELALMLARSGADVTVLSGRPHTLDPPLAERVRDIKVERLWAPQPIVNRILKMCRRPGKRPPAVRKQDENGTYERPPDHPSLLRRHYRAAEQLVDRHKLWALFAFSRAVLHRLRTQYQVVISSGPPMSAHLAGREIARVHKAKWIMDLRDLWIHEEFGSDIPPWRAAVDRAAERRCIKSADRVVCAAPSMRELLRERYPKLVGKFDVVMNGYDWSSDAPPIMGRLSLLYAGSLYFARNPFPFLDALAEFVEEADVDRSRIALTLVGHCSEWGGIDVRSFIDRRGLGDVVTVRPAVGSGEMTEMIQRSQVLVNFAQGQLRHIPAKTFEAMGAGRYVLAITEEHSDTAELIREAGIGHIVSPGAKVEMKSALRELYDAYVLRGVDLCPDRRRLAKFSRAATNRRFLEIVFQQPRVGVTPPAHENDGDSSHTSGPGMSGDVGSACCHRVVGLDATMTHGG